MRWQCRCRYDGWLRRSGGNIVTTLIDFASDTKTRPTAGMRAAMAAADVGDERANEDPTVNRLNARCAALLGKEAALCSLGLVLRPTDPLWGYYRDRALILMRGMTPREMLMASQLMDATDFARHFDCALMQMAATLPRTPAPEC